MSRPYVASTHAASLICEGVFEKYPNLMFALTEAQQLWAVAVMWHMDSDWKAIRDQTPWLKRLPSEYFRQHIRVGSQPMHEAESTEQLYQFLEMMHADETLVYCSDFPISTGTIRSPPFPNLSPQRTNASLPITPLRC